MQLVQWRILDYRRNVNLSSLNTDVFYSNNLASRSWVVECCSDNISAKANGTDIIIDKQDWYTGLGFAVGSIVQYDGKFEYTKNVPVRNVTIHHCIRYATYLKTWAGVSRGLSTPVCTKKRTITRVVQSWNLVTHVADEKASEKYTKIQKSEFDAPWLVGVLDSLCAVISLQRLSKSALSHSGFSVRSCLWSSERSCCEVAAVAVTPPLRSTVGGGFKIAESVTTILMGRPGWASSGMCTAALQDANNEDEK
jgi:hypothetical protein